MMSYLRMYRDKFVESNDLEYIYMNQSLKFVDYRLHYWFPQNEK